MAESNEEPVSVDREGAGLKESRVLIEPSMMGLFLKKLDQLSKKAVRFGLEPITIVDQREVLYEYVSEPVGRDGDRVAVSLVPARAGTFIEHPVLLNRIELKFPEVRLGNWRVVGKLEALQGQNLIFTVTQDDADRARVRDYGDHPITCEHCNKKRTRSDGFVLRDVEGSGYKQVGSACLEDFTGIDPAAALFLTKMYSVIKIAEGDLDEYAGGRGSNAISPDSYLAYTSFLTDHGGFMSATKARDTGHVPTYQEARMLPNRMLESAKIAQQFRDEADKHYARASAVRAWVMEKPVEGDFDRNLKILLAPETRYLRPEPKHLAFVAAAVPMYMQAMEFTARQARDPSRHIGAPGEKLSAQLTIRRVIEIANNFGPGAMHLVLMNDASGNSVKWKSGAVPDEIRKGEGRTFEAAFKVKEHGDYKGQSQTTVTHLKFQRWLDLDASAERNEPAVEEALPEAEPHSECKVELDLLDRETTLSPEP